LCFVRTPCGVVFLCLQPATGMKKIEGGYVLISVGQFANVCAAKREGDISLLALRVWLAAHEQKAKRCIAKRKRFSVLELAQLVRESLKTVQRALRELVSLELISWSESDISFSRDLTPVGEELAADLGTSPLRPVPVPRRILRALFRHTRPSEIMAAIGHLIRCLFIKRGEVSSGGLVKASWVASTFGIAERSVHGARKWLQSIGFLAQEAVHQLVMNRFGGKFLIVIRPAVQADTKPTPRARFAPPSITISTSSSTSNNQINNKPAPAAPGVQMEREKPPNLRDIQPDDLRRPARLEELYRQAVKAGWIDRSEASVRNFASAALRATRTGGRAAAIFVGIVRKGLWHHITQEQESRALAVLRRFRERHARDFGSDDSGKEMLDERLSDLVASALVRSSQAKPPGKSPLQLESDVRRKLLAQVSEEGRRQPR